MQQRSSVIGLNAARNFCTIAHIAVLVVALAAVELAIKTKCISLSPSFLTF